MLAGAGGCWHTNRSARWRWHRRWHAHGSRRAVRGMLVGGEAGGAGKRAAGAGLTTFGVEGLLTFGVLCLSLEGGVACGKPRGGRKMRLIYWRRWLVHCVDALFRRARGEFRIPFQFFFALCENCFSAFLSDKQVSNDLSGRARGARHSQRVSGAADNMILGRQEPIKCPVSRNRMKCPVRGTQ